MLVTPALLVLSIAGVYAAPQQTLGPEQELFSLSALEQHLSNVPEGTSLLIQRRASSRCRAPVSQICVHSRL
jgi:hypothetical protein